MQTHTSRTVSPGELPVRLNYDHGRPFVTITIADTEIEVDSTADADQGMIAFAESKRLLLLAGAQHCGEYPYPDERCTCGHLATGHSDAGGHPCTQCDCQAFQWKPEPEPEKPVDFWPSLYGPVLAGDTDGAA